MNSGAFFNFGGDTNNRTHAGNISGAGKVAKWGTSAVTLTGTNTFSGGINHNSGTLIAGAANLGTGPVQMTGNGSVSTLSLTGNIANDIHFANGSTANKVINLATGVTDAELSGTITLAADSTTDGKSRISPAAGGTIVVSGKMTGAGTGGYAKRNPGTVVITGTTNDYTGPTHVVDAGTLLVDGNVPGSVLFGQNLDGSSTAGRNGTLGGSGTIGGNLTAQSVSNIAPGGTSAAGVTTPTAAVLSIVGNLDVSALAGGSGLLWMDLDAPAGTNDRLAVGGTATIGTLALDDFAFNNLGGLAAGSYTLISSAGIVGAVDGTPGTIAPGFDGVLSISGNDVVLTVSASGGAYDTWVSSFGLAGPEAAFDFDKDLDGFDNGLEWILGGNPTIADAASIAASGVTLEFTREEDSIGVADLVVEYGTTLAAWPGSATVGASTTPPDGNGVSVTINDVPDPDEVTVNIPAINAGGTGKLFARLKAVLLP
ncbi:MAG: autotransporter-associated beta strand repeat-containing protein [Akkermansiaceae bacterium]|nr:autotransporter-associated beta strand repeat-containing protein [Akkermansiaceae bacterium]